MSHSLALKDESMQQMKNNDQNWRKYLYEFLTIFFSVILAFALTKWNENKSKAQSAEKTLLEIRNGLEADIEDFRLNRRGHENGIYLCHYFRKYLKNEAINRDTIGHYYHALLRDYISIQNISGYESLKAKGLDLIDNDSMRLEIISLYDFYYELIEKLEEQYAENQFNDAYFFPINDILARYMVFHERGDLVNITPPIDLTQKEQNLILSYLWKIEINRKFTIENYLLVEQKIYHLMEHIDESIQ